MHCFIEYTEIHAAAKETVALAEERFMTNSHNWPFDNAWQEMLNHATNKVSAFIDDVDAVSSLRCGWRQLD